MPEPSTNPAAPPSIGLGQRMGYGIGDFAFVALWQACALFLLYFYTDVLGLPPMLAGLIYLVGMAWDAVSDPIVSTWSERRAHRGAGYGRQIRVAALPAGIAFALVFTNPFNDMFAMTGWALFTHLLFRTAFTFASMPYNALPARLTTDGDERSALSAVRVIFAALGGLMTAILLPILVAGAGEDAVRTGHAVAAIALGALSALVLVICAMTMRKAPPLPADAKPHKGTAGLAGLWSATRDNRPLQGLLTLMALATVGYGLFTQSLIYLVNHVLVRPDLEMVALATPVLVIILAAPVWMMIAARTSKRNALIGGLAMAATGYIILALTPSSQAIMAIVAIAVSGVGNAAIPVMFWSMLADVVDFGHAKSGRRVETRIFGLTTFVQKAAAGLAALCAGGMLALGQYTPEAISPDALTAIRALSSWLPAVLTLAMIGVIWRYPLDRSAHHDALERIAAATTRTGG